MLEVAPGLFLIDRSEEPDLHRREGTISAVVNLSPTTPNTHPDLSYHRVPDHRRNCVPGQAVEAFREAGDFVAGHLRGGRRVAVHCNAGFQRSIPFLAWYLSTHTDCSLDQAVARMTTEPGYVECVKKVLGRDDPEGGGSCDWRPIKLPEWTFDPVLSTGAPPGTSRSSPRPQAGCARAGTA